MNDSLAVCNFNHSSVVGVKHPLRMAGLQLKKELKFFSLAFESDELHPFVAIVGGGKVLSVSPHDFVWFASTWHLFIGR